MIVQVKLYATLREYAPPNTEIGEAFKVEFNGSTLQDLIEKLGFEIDRAKIIMVNGNRVLDTKRSLDQGDLVVIFPPIGGG
jgi:molybdopterin synthase sulfur carrier subunit